LSCGICSQTCPKFKPSISFLEEIFFNRKRKKDEKFGIFKRIVLAQTTKKNITDTCQDGGVATTLLTYALENNIIDGAVLSGLNKEEPMRPIPKLALSKDEILKCAGTRYTYSPNILALQEAVLKKKKKLAFVGVPCQIHAIRRIQALPLKKYAKIKYTIGLFCSEIFTFKGLVGDLIQGILNIDPKEVKKINIKGKMLITTKSGRVESIPLKKAKKYACGFCSSCPDFSSELADISVGGLGLEGWTLVVLRNQKGEELFRKAESEGVIKVRSIEDEKKVLDRLIKFSERKREKACFKK
jgi:coenzyme F420 hydrogenase subunit beta